MGLPGICKRRERNTFVGANLDVSKCIYHHHNNNNKRPSRENCSSLHTFVLQNLSCNQLLWEQLKQDILALLYGGKAFVWLGRLQGQTTLMQCSEVIIDRLDHHDTEVTDQEMLAPDHSPINLRFMVQSKFKHSLRPGYFLFLLQDCMLGTCMLLAVGWGEGP